MCCGARWWCGIVRRSTLPFCLATLKLHQVIVQVVGCVYDVFCMACCVGFGLGYAWSYHERVGSWLVLEHVINISEEVHINDTLEWGYERGGSYVSCSHLRAATSGKVRSCWIMCVGLQVRRSVELDYERGGS